MTQSIQVTVVISPVEGHNDLQLFRGVIGVCEAVKTAAGLDDATIAEVLKDASCFFEGVVDLVRGAIPDKCQSEPNGPILTVE